MPWRGLTARFGRRVLGRFATPGNSNLRWPTRVVLRVPETGGSHVKAIVLSADGAALSDEVLIATQHPCPPEGVHAQPENRNGKSERPSQGGNDVLLAIR